MKKTSLALLSAVLCLVFSAPLFASAGEHLIPAGSLISCTVAEPRISSKTTAIGDPVLCQVGHAERYGRSVLPQDSYLVGRFEDYKDPGHFVGKGWMELKFDRMVIEPDTIIPIDARVVDVPGYKVDNQGRILGKGHETRDIVTWCIPILWPIDLLMLPARGPRPTLKEETRLTLKVMDDLGVPNGDPMQRDPYGLIQRSPHAENDMPPPPIPDLYQDQPPAAQQPVAENYDQPAPARRPRRPTTPTLPRRRRCTTATSRLRWCATGTARRQLRATPMACQWPAPTPTAIGAAPRPPLRIWRSPYRAAARPRPLHGDARNMAMRGAVGGR